MLARLELYYLRHIPSFPLYFVLVTFQIGSCTFCLEPASDCKPPPYTSWVAGITDMCYHDQIVEKVIVLTFAQTISNQDTPISSSQVAEKIGMSYHGWPPNFSIY
jgi:hypothetical protein